MEVTAALLVEVASDSFFHATGSLDAVLDQGRVGQGLLSVRFGVHDLPAASPL